MDGCFIIARSRARDGRVEKAAELLRGFLDPSRTEERCLFYDLYRDHEDRNLFVIVDGWRDRAAFDAYAGGVHVACTLEALASLL